jgi:hypothetical protein
VQTNFWQKLPPDREKCRKLFVSGGAQVAKWEGRNGVFEKFPAKIKMRG